MHFHIVTLFPEACRAYTDSSVLGRAQERIVKKDGSVRAKKIDVSYYNPRDFTDDTQRRIDDKQYGGGPGMVMQAEPVIHAAEKALGRKDRKTTKILIMSPRGIPFTQALAAEYAQKYKHMILIAGRYEGIDARVRKVLRATEISTGNYILTGGELPALTILDATARHIPGVLGSSESLEDERATQGEVYTRPASFTHRGRTYRVPQILTEGHHARIEKWRSGDKKA